MSVVLFFLLHHLTDNLTDDFRFIAVILNSYWKAVAFLKRQKNFIHGFSKCFHITSSDILVSWLSIQHSVNKDNNNCLLNATDLNHSAVYECHLPEYMALKLLHLNTTNFEFSKILTDWIFSLYKSYGCGSVGRVGRPKQMISISIPSSSSPHDETALGKILNPRFFPKRWVWMKKSYKS